VVLDYFGGSGTTAHAVINLNREDGGRRKFVLVEMGEYFDTVILPRIQKVMYVPDWKGGRPKREPRVEGSLEFWMQRSPRLVKVLRLESYEDALYNLSETPCKRERAIEGFVGKERYMLTYLSDVLLDGNLAVLRPVNEAGEVLAVWQDPESLFLRRPAPGVPGGFEEVGVDWLETGALWLGLKAKAYREFEAEGRTYRVLETERDEQKVALVIRDARGLDPEADRKVLEGHLAGFRVIVNAPPTAAFEALEDTLAAAMWEGQ
jgi:adenine-specific DNA-methyltransferase